MSQHITFRKTGHEIQQAIDNRMLRLQSRLDRRSEALESLLDDRQRLRSYLICSAPTMTRLHGGRSAYNLVSENDISSEEREEIDQMLRRISELEQEIRRLKVTSQHIDPNETFKLQYDELISYGFEEADDI